MRRVWMMVLSAGMLACGSDGEGPAGATGATTAGATGSTTASPTTGFPAGSNTEGSETTGGTAGTTGTLTGGQTTTGTMTTGDTTGGQPATTTAGAGVDAGGGQEDGGTVPADPCATVDASMGPGSQAAAASVLTQMTPCGFSSCHGNVGKGGLTLSGTDLGSLVDQPSCEAPLVPLIDGSGGSEALLNSWIWLKLTATTGGDGVLMGSEAEWGTPGACGQPGDQPYGKAMPLDATPLSDERLKAISDWICLGAPAP